MLFVKLIGNSELIGIGNIEPGIGKTTVLFESTGITRGISSLEALPDTSKNLIVGLLIFFSLFSFKLKIA
jgi:hypothetical protein